MAEGRDEAVVLPAARRHDPALDVAVGAVHVEEHRLRRVGLHRVVGHVGQPHPLRVVGRGLGCNISLSLSATKKYDFPLM